MVGDDLSRHKTVPDEQYNERADGGADKPGALTWPIQANGLAGERREKRSGYTQYRSEDKAFWRIRAGHNQPRNNSGNEADNNDPEKNTHYGSPFFVQRRVRVTYLE